MMLSVLSLFLFVSEAYPVLSSLSSGLEARRIRNIPVRLSPVRVTLYQPVFEKGEDFSKFQEGIKEIFNSRGIASEEASILTIYFLKGLISGEGYVYALREIAKEADLAKLVEDVFDFIATTARENNWQEGSKLILEIPDRFNPADYGEIKGLRALELDEHGYLNIKKEVSGLLNPDLRRHLIKFPEWFKREKKNPNRTPFLWMEYYKEEVLGSEESKVKEAIDKYIRRVREVSKGNFGSWDQWTPYRVRINMADSIAKEMGLTAREKLDLMRALSPGYRAWLWEDAIAYAQDSQEKGLEEFLNDEVAKFIDKIDLVYKVSDVPNYDIFKNLKDRISGLWEMRAVYFNTAVDWELRRQALEYQFTRLLDKVKEGGKTGDEDAWKEAKEILTEMLESPDKEVWEPALARAIYSLGREEDFWAWEAITEAINPIKYHQNPEMVEKLTLLATSYVGDSWEWLDGVINGRFKLSLSDVNRELIRRSLIEKVVPEMLMWTIPVKSDEEEIKHALEVGREKLIQEIAQAFIYESDSEMVSSLSKALVVMKYPGIANELVTKVLNNSSASAHKVAKTIEVLGSLYYSLNDIPAIRDEILWWALNAKDDNIKEAVGDALLALRSHEMKLGGKFSPPTERKVSDTTLRIQKYLKENIPTDNQLNDYLDELSKINPELNFSRRKEVIDYLDGITDATKFSPFIKALLAVKGPVEVLRGLVPDYRKRENLISEVKKIESVLEEPFDQLLTYMLARKPDFQSFEADLIAELKKTYPSADHLELVLENGEKLLKLLDQNNVVVASYRREGYFEKMHTNPIEVYVNESDEKDKILVKSGNEYTVISEYLSQRIFAEFLERYKINGKSLKELGAGVAPMRLVSDPADGKIKLAIRYLDGYEDGGRTLQPQYHDDERLKSTIFVSILIKDNDRTPWNMLFLKKNFDTTVKEIDPRPDMIFTDFASFFSLATGGFIPYWSDLTIADFNRLTSTVRHGLSEPVNEAYAKVKQSLGELYRYSKALRVILPPDKLDNITDEVFNEIASLNGGKEYGDKDEINFWISQLEAQGIFGHWNRKAPVLRFHWPIAMFKQALNKGNMREYLKSALEGRYEKIGRYFNHNLESAFKDVIYEALGIRIANYLITGLKESGDNLIYTYQVDDSLRGRIEYNYRTGIMEVYREGEKLPVGTIHVP